MDERRESTKRLKNNKNKTNVRTKEELGEPADKNHGQDQRRYHQPISQYLKKGRGIQDLDLNIN